MTRAAKIASLALLGMFALALAVPAAASERYDPRLRFRTISTRRFDIHFHQREEAIARRLAALIEDAASGVEKMLGPATGRVQVILVDQSDLSNGWATPLPYNTIEISAAGPPPGSFIGNTDDWLRLVFTHEFTHIVHLSRSRGWIGGLRRVFGRLPLLLPNQFQPFWQIEGVATWQESTRTSGGRLRAGDFRVVLEGLAARERFDPLDRASSRLIDWPGGNAPYLYGGFFHEYLAKKYGDESIRELTDATAGRLPYFGSPAFKKVFGRPLGELWDDFARASRPANVAITHAQRLTHHGFTVTSPRFARDGQRLYYSVVNPHGFPMLMEMDRARRTAREVAPRFLGDAIGLAGDKLVVDRIDLERNIGFRSDLLLVDPRTGDTKPLTENLRALDPDVSPDGMTIAFVMQQADRRVLATMPVSGADRSPRVILGEEATDYSVPRWAPDGRRIAVVRRALDKPSQIVVLNAPGSVISHSITPPGGRASSPVWGADGTSLYFTAASEREGFQVIRTDLSGTAWKLEGAGLNASGIDVSSDGETLVFVGLTEQGQDLFALPLSGASWSPFALADDARGDRSTPVHAPDVESRTYSPWRMLAPTFWTPTVESDADEIVVGAATGGVDALGRHVYAVEGGWSTRARPDWRIYYAYDRWRPTLVVTVSDDTDPWRDGQIRSIEADAGMLLPFRRIRWSHTTFASLHAADDEVECAACVEPGNGRVARRSVRLGWNLSTARIYGYSISPEEGGVFTVTTELTRAALGADGNTTASTIDLRWYLRTRPRHAVLALRAAAAASWGDEAARQIFSASGSSQGPGFDFGRDAIGLMRGIEGEDIAGSRAFVINLDYRVPLWRIDRGAGTLPIFLRTIHGALFADGGQAWSERYDADDFSVTTGAELSIDTFVGYALPLTFSAGVAWREDRVNDRSGAVAFARIGRAF